MMNQGTASSSSTAYDSDFMKKPDIAMLNGYYTDADSCDQNIFAEMRSNVLLASGDQYMRKSNAFFRRLRDNRDLSNEQKLRLVKNHVQKICKLYANNILSMNPGVGSMPKDENSLQDSSPSASFISRFGKMRLSAMEFTRKWMIGVIRSFK